jgi:hypothetical protein
MKPSVIGKALAASVVLTALNSMAAQLDCSIVYGSTSVPSPGTGSTAIGRSSSLVCNGPNPAPGCGQYLGSLSLTSEQATANIAFEGELRMTLQTNQGAEATTWIAPNDFHNNPSRLLNIKTAAFTYQGQAYDSVTLNCQITGY